MSDRERTAQWIKIGAVLLCMGAVVSVCSQRQPGDADPMLTNSGMLALQDPRSGCQYLTTPHGGLVKRIGPGGEEHMGCRPLPAPALPVSP